MAPPLLPSTSALHGGCPLERGGAETDHLVIKTGRDRKRHFPGSAQDPCDRTVQPPEEHPSCLVPSLCSPQPGSERSLSRPFFVPSALFLVLSCLGETSLACSVPLCSLAHPPWNLSDCQEFAGLSVCPSAPLSTWLWISYPCPMPAWHIPRALHAFVE